MSNAPKKSFLKQALRVTLLLVLVLVVGVGGLVGVTVWRFNASAPALTGEAVLPGAEGPIDIVRDEHGVPHIFAQSETDLYRGLGYAHAQDRFFQMDATRRAMQGRLSELLGERTLPMDARARIMGWSAVAEAQWQALSPEAKAVIAAYTEGVNAFLAQGPAPPEYVLLWARPEPWRPQDSLAVSLAMTDTLTSGAGLERARERLSDVLDADQIDQFLAGYPAFAPTSYPEQSLAAGPIAAGLESRDPGSNAWVVSGTRTQGGRPILANDPHLPLAAPGPFYLSRLQGPDGPLIGASLPGAPNIVIGRTNDLAWGTTTHAIDAEDDVILTPDMAVTERRETIRVRAFVFFQKEETITVRRTEMGPVLDRAWFDLDGLYEGQEVVLRTIADDPDNGVAEAVYQASKAKTVDAYFEALRPWTAPPQNLVVADAQGNIGLISPGRFPARDSGGVWRGDIPDRILAANPTQGFFATANNLQTPRSFQFPMPGGHDPYRVALITERLEADQSVTLEDMAALQTDQLSLLARRLRPAVLTATAETAAGQAMQALLAAWDSVTTAEGVEGAAFALWLRALGEELYADELGEALYARFSGPREVFLDGVFNGDLSASWCDDVATPDQTETCNQVAGTALDSAAAALAALADGAESPRWGDLHAARFAHPLLSSLPLIGDRFAILVPFGGNGTTINVARNWHDADDYETVHAAGMRMIVDFNNLDASLFMLAPGQSGNPISPYFTSLAAPWSRGEYFQIRSDWTVDGMPSGASRLRLHSD